MLTKRPRAKRATGNGRKTRATATKRKMRRKKKTA